MTTHPFAQNDPWGCPRCGDVTRDYPALSRWDNTTDICSDCGTEEAMLQHAAQAGGREAVARIVHPIHGAQPWVNSPVSA